VLGLSLFIVAGVMLAEHRDLSYFRGAYAPALAIGGVITLLGLAIVGVGVAGRKIGGLTSFALVVMFIGFPVLAAVDATSGVMAGGSAIGDPVWRPTSENLVDTYELGIGDALLDLTRIPAGDETVTLDYDVGIGQAKLIVPANRAVAVTATVDIGAIDLNLPPDWTVDWGIGPARWKEIGTGNRGGASGFAARVEILSPEAAESGGENLDLEINSDVAIGHLVVLEGDLA
jgi:hypothetical protein